MPCEYGNAPARDDTPQKAWRGDQGHGQPNRRPRREQGQHEAERHGQGKNQHTQAQFPHNRRNGCRIFDAPGVKHLGKILFQPCLLCWSALRSKVLQAGIQVLPFVLESKEPSNGFREFLLSEVRYSSLKRQFPERAEMLYEKAEADAKARRSNYTRLANK